MTPPTTPPTSPAACRCCGRRVIPPSIGQWRWPAILLLCPPCQAGRDATGYCYECDRLRLGRPQEEE